MKPHDINKKFLELSTLLENFAEGEIKHLIACVHVLWLTDDAEKQKDALSQMAKIADAASTAYQKTKANFDLNIHSEVKSKNFDLSTWLPDTDVIQ